jgi:hypothetical protein
MIDPLRAGRHSSTSPKGRSPYNSSGDERGHSHGKRRKHRDHSTGSPTRSYNRKNLDKFGVPMSRGSSHDSRDSWGRGSDANSSAYSSRSVESGGQRRSHRHSHTHYPHQYHSSSTAPHNPGFEHPSRPSYRGGSSPPRSSGYTDLPRREYVQDLRADDYPYGTSPPRDRAYEPGSRPLPHRRYTTQENPMATNAVPLSRPTGPTYNNHPADILLRTNREQPIYTYPTDAYAFPQPQARYLSGNSPVEPDRFKMDEFADAFLDAIKSKDGRRVNEPPRVPLRRFNTERRPTGDEDWDRERGYPAPRGAAYVPYSRYS